MYRRVAVFIVAVGILGVTLPSGFGISIRRAFTQAGGSVRKTVWSGVYTAAQAKRGDAAYEENCVSCHQNDFDPSQAAARFRGDYFMTRWREYNVGSLFNLIRATMPQKEPGSLSDQVYIDIVARILQANDFPAAAEELTTGALKTIQIEGKDGPQPVPDGSLVQVAGCLTADDVNRAWLLTNATEPARTESSKKSTPEELEVAAAKESGNLVIRLQNLGILGNSFSPGSHIGQRMQAKGHLIRNKNRPRLDITSIETLSPDCQP